MVDTTNTRDMVLIMNTPNPRELANTMLTVKRKVTMNSKDMKRTTTSQTMRATENTTAITMETDITNTRSMGTMLEQLDIMDMVPTKDIMEEVDITAEATPITDRVMDIMVTDIMVAVDTTDMDMVTVAIMAVMAVTMATMDMDTTRLFEYRNKDETCRNLRIFPTCKTIFTHLSMILFLFVDFAISLGQGPISFQAQWGGKISKRWMI